MLNNNSFRTEPSAHPPPFSLRQHQNYQPHYNAKQPLSPVAALPQPPPPVPPQSPAVPVALLPQPGVPPPMIYAAPGAVQQIQPPAPKPPALKPAQPPPAPALHDIMLTEERQHVRCPYCYNSIITKTTFKVGTMTHIAGLAVFFVCCPLFYIPYLVDCCKDVSHSCPTCHRTIGLFRRFT